MSHQCPSALLASFLFCLAETGLCAVFFTVQGCCTHVVPLAGAVGLNIAAVGAPNLEALPNPKTSLSDAPRPPAASRDQAVEALCHPRPQGRTLNLADIVSDVGKTLALHFDIIHAMYLAHVCIKIYLHDHLFIYPCHALVT